MLARQLHVPNALGGTHLRVEAEVAVAPQTIRVVVAHAVGPILRGDVEGSRPHHLAPGQSHGWGNFHAGVLGGAVDGRLCSTRVDLDGRRVDRERHGDERKRRDEPGTNRIERTQPLARSTEPLLHQTVLGQNVGVNPLGAYLYPQMVGAVVVDGYHPRGQRVDVSIGGAVDRANVGIRAVILHHQVDARPQVDVVEGEHPHRRRGLAPRLPQTLAVERRRALTHRLGIIRRPLVQLARLELVLAYLGCGFAAPGGVLANPYGWIRGGCKGRDGGPTRGVGGGLLGGGRSGLLGGLFGGLPGGLGAGLLGRL